MDIDEIATGETWLGPDALSRNMVDELSTVDDVLLGHARAGAEVLGLTLALTLTLTLTLALTLTLTP